MLSFQIRLQRFADTDVADDVFALAVNGVQRSLGFFFGAVFQLGEFEAALTVEFVLDDIFGRLGHGHTCLSASWSVIQLSFVLERRMILIEWVRVGLRVTLIARRLTVSMVMFQKPVLGAVMRAGNVSNAPPW
jgi:hypothetical protein